jgi:hypothetical protein
VEIKINDAERIMKRLGIDAQGRVQKFHTANVLRRIEKYMPYRTGLTIKLMIAQSPVNKPEIRVNVPYAKRLYYGYSAKGNPLKYNKTKNPLAGPKWDVRLAAVEGAAMLADLQRFAGGTR